MSISFLFCVIKILLSPGPFLRTPTSDDTVFPGKRMYILFSRHRLPLPFSSEKLFSENLSEQQNLIPIGLIV